MIGFWNYTVILTYMSLASAACGMTLAINEQIIPALICLAFSGLCDALDGRVARLKKDRSDSEKLFGIQLDSLCDVISFGFLPVVICYQLGLTSPVGIGAMIFYCIASVARLAYFNMVEISKDSDDTSPKCYHGLPITSIVVIFPVFYMVSGWIPASFHNMLWEFMLLASGCLFISNIRFGKPKLKHIIFFTVIVIALFVVMVFFRG